jgi:5'-nucleotidase
VKVLLTNDDGIQADGLQALRVALVEVPGVEVAVVAPDGNRSAMARSITTRRPLWVEEVPFEDGTVGYATDGTPVDCVRLARLGLVEGFDADVIVSGINHGANLGDDITYSGTVAAALEGVVLGLPAIAVSQQARGGGEDWYDDARFDYGPTCAVVAQLAQRVFDDGLPDGTMLNVNGPGRDDGPLGVRLTRLGRRIYGTAVTHDVDEAGRRHYRLYDQPPRHHDESGTDLAAVDAGYVSVSPLRLRLDDTSAHEQLASWRIEELA